MTGARIQIRPAEVRAFGAVAIFFASCGGRLAVDETSLAADGGASFDASARDESEAGSDQPTVLPGQPAQGDAARPPPSDAGPPRTITCGTAVCSESTQSCCVDQWGESVCIKRGDRCDGALLRCSDSTSCQEGKVCCYDLNYGWTKCVPVDECPGSFGSGPGPGPGAGVVLCVRDGDCPPGETCTQTPYSGIRACQRSP